MPTLFTRILQRELPGHLLWRDDVSAAFLTIAPIRPGHALVVPVLEVDHWLDLPSEVAQHLCGVAQEVGRAQMAVFSPARVGLIIAGLEVPHAHLHVIPIETEADLDFGRADPSADQADLAAHAASLRAALREAGRSEVVDD